MLSAAAFRTGSASPPPPNRAPPGGQHAVPPAQVPICSRGPSSCPSRSFSLSSSSIPAVAAASSPSASAPPIPQSCQSSAAAASSSARCTAGVTKFAAAAGEAAVAERKETGRDGGSAGRRESWQTTAASRIWPSSSRVHRSSCSSVSPAPCTQNRCRASGPDGCRRRNGKRGPGKRARVIRDARQVCAACNKPQ